MCLKGQHAVSNYEVCASIGKLGRQTQRNLSLHRIMLSLVYSTAWGLETWHQKLLSKNVKNSVVPQFHSLHSYLPATTTYRVSCMGTRYSPLEYTRAVFSIPAFSCKSLFIQWVVPSSCVGGNSAQLYRKQCILIIYDMLVIQSGRMWGRFALFYRYKHCRYIWTEMKMGRYHFLSCIEAINSLILFWLLVFVIYINIFCHSRRWC
jgi:hypothetical protein